MYGLQPTERKQIKLHAEWQARRGHSVVVFKNKLWLFGGSVSSGKVNQPSTTLLNDIWSSADGENWVNETQQANWSTRDPQVIAFNNKLYMVGDADKTDVWTSVNGKEWTMLTNRAGWNARQNFGLQVYDDKLCVFGGREHNDVWYSIDGKNWLQQTSAAHWSRRTVHHSIAYLNRLWVYSGKTGREDSWAGDVWVMEKWPVDIES